MIFKFESENLKMTNELLLEKFSYLRLDFEIAKERQEDVNKFI